METRTERDDDGVCDGPKEIQQGKMVIMHNTSIFEISSNLLSKGIKSKELFLVLKRTLDLRVHGEKQ